MSAVLVSELKLAADDVDPKTKLLIKICEELTRELEQITRDYRDLEALVRSSLSKK